MERGETLNRRRSHTRDLREVFIIMSATSFATSVARTALFAVALSACAHQSAQLSPTTPSYAGGRAAQPGGFLPSAQRASFEQAPARSYSGPGYLGGQAGQPHAWLGSESQSVVLMESNCLAAGRAAQPFSGPSVYAVTSVDESSVACRTDGAAARF